MVVGSGIPGEGGTAWAYESDNVLDWTFKGPFYISNYEKYPFLGDKWELPVVLPLGKYPDGEDRYVMIISPKGYLQNVEVYYWLGRFDKEISITEFNKEELLEMLNLEDKKYNYIDELSGGQQQRVAIARALASKPEIILADEPTGNLDSVNYQEVLDVLRKSQRKYNQTIILVTHDARIASYADRIIRIEDGQIVGEHYEK